MVLSGQADAMDRRPATAGEYPADRRPIPTLRLILGAIGLPSAYLLFNQRDPREPLPPHPVLADLRVRRAITLALDRRLMVQAVFGSYGEVPYGPVSPILWIRQPCAASGSGRTSRKPGGSWRRRAGVIPTATASWTVKAVPLTLQPHPAQHQRDPPADVAPGAGTAASARHQARAATARDSGLERAAARRALRHRFRGCNARTPPPRDSHRAGVAPAGTMWPKYCNPRTWIP